MISSISHITPIKFNKKPNRFVSFGSNSDSFIRQGRCANKFVDLGETLHSPGVYPEEYTTKISRTLRKIKPHYYIFHLYANTPGNGYGTAAIKQVVRKSCKDKRTNGRVLVGAYPICYNSYPAGFYYKLGFRFKNDESNQIMQKWIANGGQKEDAPMEEGQMYLPQKNISLCLSYKSK